MILDEFGDEERYHHIKRAAFNEGNDQAIVAFALIEVAKAIEQSGKDISNAIRLGLADAATPLEAIETLSKEILDGTERLATAINSLSKD